CHSHSGAKREGDGEVSIDTQPALVDTPATANPPRRKICVVSPNEFRVDRDEEGNAHAMDGRIINIHVVHPPPSYPPELATYIRDHVDIATANDRMFDEYCIIEPAYGGTRAERGLHS
ncbi:hypothetical protein HID58_034176, partial [Brassica napus]